MSDDAEDRAAKRAAWKKKDFAKTKARQDDKQDPDEAISTDWKLHRAAFEGRPSPDSTEVRPEINEAYVGGYLGAMGVHSEVLDAALTEGTIISARETDDPTIQKLQRETKIRELQAVVDEMANAVGFNDPAPVLLVHTADSPILPLIGENAHTAVGLTNYIDLNQASLAHFEEHPDQFRAAMALTIAQLVNGHTAPETKIHVATNPPTQELAVNAAKLGAIIHGNPREYADAMHDLAQTDVSRKDRPFIHKMQDMSIDGTGRMLHKWADMLEDRGAVDAKGNVNLEGAIELYQEARDFTRRYTNTMLQFGMNQPEGRGGR